MDQEVHTSEPIQVLIMVSSEKTRQHGVDIKTHEVVLARDTNRSVKMPGLGLLTFPLKIARSENPQEGFKKKFLERFPVKEGVDKSAKFNWDDIKPVEYAVLPEGISAVHVLQVDQAIVDEFFGGALREMGLITLNLLHLHSIIPCEDEDNPPTLPGTVPDPGTEPFDPNVTYAYMKKGESELLPQVVALIWGSQVLKK